MKTYRTIKLKLTVDKDKDAESIAILKSILDSSKDFWNFLVDTNNRINKYNYINKTFHYDLVTKTNEKGKTKTEKVKTKHWNYLHSISFTTGCALAPLFFDKVDIHSHLYQEIAKRFDLATAKAYDDFAKSKKPNKKIHFPKIKDSFEDYKSIKFKQKNVGYKLDLENGIIKFNKTSNQGSFKFEIKNPLHKKWIAESEIKYVQLKYNSDNKIYLYVYIYGDFTLDISKPNTLNQKTLNNHPVQRVVNKYRKHFFSKIEPKLPEEDRKYLKQIRDHKKRNIPIISTIKNPKGHSDINGINTSSIGIDNGCGYGNTFVLSDNNQIAFQETIYVIQSRLDFAKSKLRRKVIGSKNYIKLLKEIENLEDYLVNFRDDSLHKISKYLVKTYDTIYMEDIQSAALAEDSELSRINRQLYNASFGRMKIYLDYKSAMLNKKFNLINPEYTSQVCSNINCTETYEGFVKKDLSNRVHCCKCGLCIDRDANAARNIQQLGSNPQFVKYFESKVELIKKNKKTEPVNGLVEQATQSS